MMNFGQALELLKNNKKVARKGWNGKGMSIMIFQPQILVAQSHNGRIGEKEYLSDDDKRLPVLPAIYMKTADDKFVPWLASQTDILAEDWEEVK